MGFIKNTGIVLLSGMITLLILIQIFVNTNNMTIMGAIGDDTESYVSSELKLFNYVQLKGERILLTLDSPGGSANSLNIILDDINGSIIPVDTLVTNHVASAAAVLFMKGDHRYVSKTATLLFHGAHNGTYTLTQVTLENTLYQLDHGRLMDILRKRVPQDSLSLEELKALEVALILLPEVGLNGFEQYLRTYTTTVTLTNTRMINEVLSTIKRINPLVTFEEVRRDFFGDFKKDIYFTGQQLIDMGLAEEYIKGSK